MQNRRCRTEDAEQKMQNQKMQNQRSMRNVGEKSRRRRVRVADSEEDAKQRRKIQRRKNSHREPAGGVAAERVGGVGAG
jgi:hypothetical protein